MHSEIAHHFADVAVQLDPIGYLRVSIMICASFGPLSIYGSFVDAFIITILQIVVICVEKDAAFNRKLHCFGRHTHTFHTLKRKLRFAYQIGDCFNTVRLVSGDAMKFICRNNTGKISQPTPYNH